MTIGFAGSDVIWTTPGSSIDEAIELMEHFGIHHLPVVDHDRVVGMLSDRDLLLMVGWKLHCERRLGNTDRVVGPDRIAQIMSTPVVTLAPNASLEDAARLLFEHRIGALPLTDADRIVGIVTESDVLRQLCRAASDARAAWQLLRRPVREIMTVQPVTVGPRASIDDVSTLFAVHGIRHLPVVADEELLGILSDRDLRRALGESSISDTQAQQRGQLYLGPRTVMQIMTTPVQSIGPDDLVADAIDDLLAHAVHALPVVDGRLLVGILTAMDIFKTVSSLPGDAEVADSADPQFNDGAQPPG